MSYAMITCGHCGHQDDFDAFTRTPVFGDLPKGVIQCPNCGIATEKRHGTPALLESGFVMPGAVSLVQIDSRL